MKVTGIGIKSKEMGALLFLKMAPFIRDHLKRICLKDKESSNGR
jgi:hypothetical protein